MFNALFMKTCNHTSYDLVCLLKIIIKFYCFNTSFEFSYTSSFSIVNDPEITKTSEHRNFNGHRR